MSFWFVYCWWNTLCLGAAQWFMETLLCEGQLYREPKVGSMYTHMHWPVLHDSQSLSPSHNPSFICVYCRHFFLFKGYYGLDRIMEIFGKMQVWLWRMAPEPLSSIWPQPSLWLSISQFISICKIIGFNWLIPVASCHFFLKIFLAGWLRIFPNHWTVLEYNPFTVMNCKLFFCSLRNKNVLKCTVCPVFLQAFLRGTFWDSAIELFVNGCRKISYTYD